MLFIARPDLRLQNGSAERPGHIKWASWFLTLPACLMYLDDGSSCEAQMFHSAGQLSTSKGVRSVHTSTEKTDFQV